MAFNPVFFDSATPCRLGISVSGDDAAANLLITNAQLVAACVPGPLKTFLSTALTNPAQQSENLRIVLLPAGITGATPGVPDANAPNWGVAPGVDGSFKTTLEISQAIAAATMGASFGAFVWLEYVHSVVR